LYPYTGQDRRLSANNDGPEGTVVGDFILPVIDVIAREFYQLLDGYAAAPAGLDFRPIRRLCSLCGYSKNSHVPGSSFE
jgi:hypothetical protein